jgi:predicted DNA-binding transcriptional regulator AlpA
MTAPDFLTVATVAERMGLHADTLKRRLKILRDEHGMPAPLPWSQRQHRWNRAAIEAWLARWERQAGAAPPAPLTPLTVVKPDADNRMRAHTHA